MTIILSCIVCHAQEGLTGRVTDMDGRPLNGATIVHFNLPDSTILAFTYSDADGQFSLPTGLSGVVEVSYVGYKRKDCVVECETLVIALEEESNKIQEAMVSAVRASSITMDSGKFTYRPGSLDIALPDTYELLRNTPLLTVEEDKVSILGKGASTVYINGREAKMSSDMIADYLRSIPTTQIDKIEIITSPDATKKADTEGGIVNIVLKAPTEGFAGNASVSASYAYERFSPTAKFSLRYAKSKFSASLSERFQR